MVPTTGSTTTTTSTVVPTTDSTPTTAAPTTSIAVGGDEQTGPATEVLGDTVSRNALAFTGTGVTVLTVLGLLLIGLGSALLVSTRRLRLS